MELFFATLVQMMPVIGACAMIFGGIVLLARSLSAVCRPRPARV